MIEQRWANGAPQRENGVHEKDKWKHIFSINFNTYSNNVVIFYDEYLHLDGLRHTKNRRITMYGIFGNI